MKVFLSTTFYSKVGEDGYLEPQHRQKLEALIELLEQNGDEVYCATRQNKWYQKDDDNPTAVFQTVLENLDDADIVLVLIEATPSAGVQIEIGYALAKQKPLILAYPADASALWTNKAVAGFDTVTELSYTEINDLSDKFQMMMPVAG